MSPARGAALPWLGAILLAALALRLYGVSFGLPALYDPDEPTFVLLALRMLHDRTLDPGWFGHPGTTTIASLALIDLIVLAAGTITGRFADTAAFGRTVYADPTLVFLPGRLFIVLCGLLCVLLTFAVGARLFDRRVGLLAAALLAIDPLHVRYSQIIRTDVHATVFMLLCVLCSIGIARRGRLIDMAGAAVCVGLACATKWPAAAIGVCPLAAGLLRIADHPEETGKQLRHLLFGAVLAPVSLVLASPYLLLDYRTLLANLHGEARPEHLGATGGGPLRNAGWYVAQPLRGALGLPGLVLAGAGAVLAGWRSRLALATIVAPAALFFAVIAVQALIWARWVLPLLPFAAILIAWSIAGLAGLARRRFGRRAGALAGALLALAVAAPMLLTVRADAIERLHDTRGLASGWAIRHIPAGSTVVVEQISFDLVGQPWRLLLPAGDAGCIDAARTIRGQASYARISGWRGKRSVLSLGTVAPRAFATCRADYAILSNYDRYRADAARFPAELAVYEKLMASGTQMAMFAPSPGRTGGPVIRIVRLRAPA